MDLAVLFLMLALIALVSGVLCAVVASEKNRDSGIWGVVGFLFPILSLIAIAGIPEKTLRIRECLFCAELIGIEATICPFCNRELKPVVHCKYSHCDTTHIESEQAVYRLCGKEGCDEQHAFCSESHADMGGSTLLASGHGVAYNRGIAYHRLGQYERAIQDYTEAISLDPQHADAYYDRGFAYEKLGKQEQADRDFAKAKEHGYKPDDPDL